MKTAGPFHGRMTSMTRDLASGCTSPMVNARRRISACAAEMGLLWKTLTSSPPTVTASPICVASCRPTPWSTLSDVTTRPAPSSHATCARPIASMAVTKPADTELMLVRVPPIGSAVHGSSQTWAATDSVTPWATIICRNFSRAEPSWKVRLIISRPSSIDAALPLVNSSWPPSSFVSSKRSAGPLPLRVSMVSMISSELPMRRPMGLSISVSTATVLTALPLPAETMLSASARASSSVFMKAALPTFTSSTRELSPSATFFETIEELMSGMDSTVDVISRIAYRILSPGTSVFVWPTMQQPTLAMICDICATLCSTLKPGMDSSLSRVPPV
eukprot:m.559474 g.559474  ORF g.559474 m.559474 type:complete len:332 (+) comp57774_c0_seq1:107-1102(+)